jgi:hypothetical protein
MMDPDSLHEEVSFKNLSVLLRSFVCKMSSWQGQRQNEGEMGRVAAPDKHEKGAHASQSKNVLKLKKSS